MKIKYKSNLTAGFAAILAAVILVLLIPSQIAEEPMATYGITSRTLPYIIAAMMGICGLVLLFQSFMLKKDEVKELELKKEFKGVIYMLCLLAYAIGFSHSFLISTSLLGIVTLFFLRCKKAYYYLIVVQWYCCSISLLRICCTFACHNGKEGSDIIWMSSSRH